MNNRQAVGYMLLACKAAGMNKRETNTLFAEMYFLFDIKHEEEAEEQGYHHYRSLQDEKSNR